MTVIRSIEEHKTYGCCGRRQYQVVWSICKMVCGGVVSEMLCGNSGVECCVATVVWSVVWDGV